MNEMKERMSLPGAGDQLKDVLDLMGRLALLVLFLVSGVGKILNYSGTAAFMEAAGVPSLSLPLAILVEVGGSLAILAGWRVLPVSIVMAGFTAATALLFHVDFSDETQKLMFLKNISIAGAFLILAANGPRRFSLDWRRLHRASRE